MQDSLWQKVLSNEKLSLVTEREIYFLFQVSGILSTVKMQNFYK